MTRMINQCSSCGGFCKKSGCERENVKPTPQRTWIELTDEEIHRLADKHLQTKNHDGALIVLGLEDFAKALMEKMRNEQ